LGVVAARKRATYDMFGEEGLKNGVPVGTDESSGWTPGYSFHGDADRVFRDFFGGDNPFQGLLMVTCYSAVLKLLVMILRLLERLGSVSISKYYQEVVACVCATVVLAAMSVAVASCEL